MINKNIGDRIILSLALLGTFLPGRAGTMPAENPAKRLFSATQQGDLATVASILEQTMQTMPHGDKFRSLLMAIQEKQIQVVNTFISSGAFQSLPKGLQGHAFSSLLEWDPQLLNATLIDSIPVESLGTDGKTTRLLTAAKYGHTTILQGLLAQGDISKETRILIVGQVIMGGHIAILTPFLKDNTLQSLDDHERFELLKLAIQHGHAEIAKMLIQHGVDPNFISESVSEPAAMKAYFLQKNKIAKELLECQEVDVNAVGISGAPLILYAIMSKDEDFALSLLNAGADPNTIYPRTGDSALHAAISANLTRLTKALIEERADVEARNNRGEGVTEVQGREPGLDAYYYACQRIANESTPHHRLLRQYAEAISKGDIQRAINALDSGLCVDAIVRIKFDSNGKFVRLPLLYMALLYNKKDQLEPVVAKLLEKNVDTHKNPEVATLALACMKPNVSSETRKKIFEHNNQSTLARLKDHQSRVKSEFFKVIREGNLKNFHAVLRKKPKITEPNSEGQTPLIVAVLAKNILACEHLLQLNAQTINHVDNAGKTAVNYARQLWTEQEIDEVFGEFLHQAVQTPRASKSTRNNQTAREFFAEKIRDNLLVDDQNHQMTIEESLRLIAEAPSGPGGEIQRRQGMQELKDIRAENPFLKDNRGETLLDIARKNNNVEMINLLEAYISTLSRAQKRQFEREAEKSYRARQRSIRQSKKNSTAKTITERALNPWNQKNKGGITRLMLSAQFGQEQKVQQALVEGANPHLKDQQGRTAQDYARTKGYLKIAEILAKAEAQLAPPAQTALDDPQSPSTGQHKMPGGQKKNTAEQQSTGNASSNLSDDNQTANTANTNQVDNADKKKDNKKSVETPLRDMKEKHTADLFAAIEQSKLKGVKKLVGKELDMDQRNGNGDSLLIAGLKVVMKAQFNPTPDKRAVEKAQQIVRELLTHQAIRASIDTKGHRKKTALMIAVQDEQCLTWLLELCKPILTKTDEQDHTAFMHAAQKSSPRVMQTLVAHAKTKLSAKDLETVLTQASKKGKTALILAAQAGNSDIVNLLIETLNTLPHPKERECSVKQDIYAASKILQAKYGHESSVNEEKKDDDDDNETVEPLPATPPATPVATVAITDVQKRFTEALRRKQNKSTLEAIIADTPGAKPWLAKPIIIDGKNTTVLHIALEHGVTQKTLAWLLKQVGHGVINMRDYAKRAPLELAINTQKRGVIKLLLKHNARVSHYQSEPGAIEHTLSPLERVKAIVAEQQNPEVQKHWQTLLELMRIKYATENSQEKLRYPSEEQAQRKKQSDKERAILEQGIPTTLTTVSKLLATGFDINTVLKDGMTLLMHAAQAGKTDSVAFLLKKEANPLITDPQGKTAFGYASENNHARIANHLCIAAALHDFKTNNSSWGHINDRHRKPATEQIRSGRSYSKDRPFYLRINTNDRTQKVDQFPEGWSTREAKTAIARVMSSPTYIADKHADITYLGEVIRGALIVEGVHKGVSIRVIISSVDNPTSTHQWRIFTAYPVAKKY